MGNAFWGKNMLGEELDTLLARRISPEADLIPVPAARAWFGVHGFALSQI
jgi:hypothetical protein